MSRENQRAWPRMENGNQRNAPTAAFTSGDGYLKSDRSLVGPLRMGTAPGVGPRGRAVIADYETRTDYGTDMVARDRKTERKFPSDLLAREIRGNGPRTREDIISDNKRMPK